MLASKFWCVFRPPACYDTRATNKMKYLRDFIALDGLATLAL
jgi:hypothetical protein